MEIERDSLPNSHAGELPADAVCLLLILLEQRSAEQMFEMRKVARIGDCVTRTLCHSEMGTCRRVVLASYGFQGVFFDRCDSKYNHKSPGSIAPAVSVCSCQKRNVPRICQATCAFDTTISPFAQILEWLAVLVDDFNFAR